MRSPTGFFAITEYRRSKLRTASPLKARDRRTHTHIRAAAAANDSAFFCGNLAVGHQRFGPAWHRIAANPTLRLLLHALAASISFTACGFTSNFAAAVA